MNERTANLRRQSLDTPPSISGERAGLLTEFYQANDGRYSVPVMRARAFLHLCEHKTIYLGEDELIVGERGPRPKAVPTFPELTCHSVEDLKILNSRPKTWYRVDDETPAALRGKGHSLLARALDARPDVRGTAGGVEGGLRARGSSPSSWSSARRATRCWTTRSTPRACSISNATSRQAIAKLDFLNDPEAYEKRETLKSFDISCDAVILFAERHAALARELAAKEADARSAGRSC